MVLWPPEDICSISSFGKGRQSKKNWRRMCSLVRMHTVQSFCEGQNTAKPEINYKCSQFSFKEEAMIHFSSKSFPILSSNSSRRHHEFQKFFLNIDCSSKFLNLWYLVSYKRLSYTSCSALLPLTFAHTRIT